MMRSLLMDPKLVAVNIQMNMIRMNTHYLKDKSLKDKV